MAAEDVQATIKRALLDDTFRLGLVRSFDKCIQENFLTLDANETKALKQVDWANLNVAAGGGGTWVHIYA